MNLGATLDQYVASASFMSRTFGTVSLPAGTPHTLRLTVTGRNGASGAYTLSADTITLTPISVDPIPTFTPTPTPTGSPVFTPTPTPTPTQPSGNAYIWSEAEALVTTPPMTVSSDAAASGGSYIAGPIGTNSTGAAPSTGWATLTFTAPTSGTYRIWGRVIAPADTDDSFWVRMDGGTWINWNDIVPGASWHWGNVTNDASNDAVVQYSLAAGTHTVNIAYREDGARLDKVLITNDAAFTPSGLGE
jgi:hypothetical protein